MSWSSIAHLPIMDRIISFSSFCIRLPIVSSGSMLFYQKKFWAASLPWCVGFYKSLPSFLHYFFSKQGVLLFQPIPCRKVFHIFDHSLNIFVPLWTFSSFVIIYLKREEYGWGRGSEQCTLSKIKESLG